MLPGRTLGRLLRGARLREGLAQEELASKVGVVRQDVSEMEHGKRPIGAAMAQRLAAALQVDYRIFL